MSFIITFAPRYNSGVIVNANTTSASQSFTKGAKSMCLTNQGAETCYVQISKDLEIASSADYPVPPNSQVTISISGEADTLNYVTVSGTTALHFMLGEGF